MQDVTICALVSVSSGENVVPLVPVVMPLSTAQPTASSAQCPAGMSVNLSDPRLADWAAAMPAIPATAKTSKTVPASLVLIVSPCR